jgi:prevent-host-death family protein
MKDVMLSEDVFPIAEFKKQASRLFRRVKEAKRPIVVTQNGTPVGVVIPAEEYDRIRERARFIEAVEDGLRQSDSGRLISSEEVDKELDREFGPSRKSKSR